MEYIIGTAPLYSNLSVLIKLAVIIIGSISLVTLTSRQSSKGRMMGYKHFCQMIEKYKNKEISEEEFEKRINEKR